MGMSGNMDNSYDVQDTAPFNGNSDDVFVQERVQAVEDVLKRTSDDHHLYEQSILDGKRDENWAAWYAKHAYCRGIVEALGFKTFTDAPVDLLDSYKLAQFLTTEAPDEGGSWTRNWAEKLVAKFPLTSNVA